MDSNPKPIRIKITKEAATAFAVFAIGMMREKRLAREQGSPNAAPPADVTTPASNTPSTTRRRAKSKGRKKPQSLAV